MGTTIQRILTRELLEAQGWTYGHDGAVLPAYPEHKAMTFQMGQMARGVSLVFVPGPQWLRLSVVGDTLFVGRCNTFLDFLKVCELVEVERLLEERSHPELDIWAIDEQVKPVGGKSWPVVPSGWLGHDRETGLRIYRLGMVQHGEHIWHYIGEVPAPFTLPEVY